MLTFTRHNVHRVIKYTADSELMPSGCQSNKVVMVHQVAAVDIFSVQRFIVFFQEIFQMLFTFESFVLFCISVCIFRFTHSINDLFNSVQANDARVFLVRPCISGFTLCGGYIISLAQGKNNSNKHTVHQLHILPVCSCQL